ncbi:hypothetical protein [Desulfoluna spongiiphila]|uniref:Uncharacterized protein n=1 Tax=Desulfoluna spongiiphila TaxID=419481 RepID=A0A1G5E309_9BACT|nr:hypothetical protein [Desulfoluna spongiiphila]SCY21245.1 hypothetical protein SAMN05216233_105136 [Desulfoluna spongiiphila]
MTAYEYLGYALLLFFINYGSSRIVFMLYRVCLSKRVGFWLPVWCKRLLFVVLGAFVLQKIALKSGAPYLEPVLVVSGISYGLTWARIFIKTVVHRFRGGMDTYPGIKRWMLKGLFEHVCAVCLGVVSALWVMGSNPLAGVTFFPGNNPFATFFLLNAYGVSGIYMLCGIIYIVVSSRSTLLLRGFGVLMGMLALGYGIALGAVLILCSKAIAGLLVAFSGLFLFMFLENSKGTSSPLPMIIPVFVILSVFSGVGLMVSGME